MSLLNSSAELLSLQADRERIKLILKKSFIILWVQCDVRKSMQVKNIKKLLSILLFLLLKKNRLDFFFYQKQSKILIYFRMRIWAQINWFLGLWRIVMALLMTFPSVNKSRHYYHCVYVCHFPGLGLKK